MALSSEKREQSVGDGRLRAKRSSTLLWSNLIFSSLLIGSWYKLLGMKSPRRSLVAIMIMVVGIASASAQTPATEPRKSTAKRPASAAKPKSPVVRQPFTLRLKVDKEHYSDVHFEKQPYVSQNEVYLFSGDKFGVNLVVTAGRVTEVRYQPDATKADVWFGFEQPKELQDGLSMALTIDNKMKREVSMEGLMSIPGKKDVFKTSILPVKAGKSGLESWPHPISQLVLGNLRLTAEEAAPAKK